jgi:hypothetical protein
MTDKQKMTELTDAELDLVTGGGNNDLCFINGADKGKYSNVHSTDAKQTNDTICN